MFGAYFHLPPYFSHVINEGSNETAEVHSHSESCVSPMSYVLSHANDQVHLRIHVRAFTKVSIN